MANHNNSRNRSRSGFHQEWDNDDNINFPTTNIENQRSRMRASERTRDYGNIYNDDSHRNGNRNDYEGNNSNNDWNNHERNYQDRDNYGNGGRDNYRNDQREDNRNNYRGNMNQWTNTRYPDERNGGNRYNENQQQHGDRDWWDRTRDEVSSWFGDDDAQRRRNMDERQGEHRGKGPKGYTRSDDRIKEDVNDRLSDDTNVDASDIEVSVESSEVTLTGTVKSRWEKRRAEDLAESISGVKNVENRLRVTQATSNFPNRGTDAGNSETGTGATPGKKSQIGTYQPSKS